MRAADFGGGQTAGPAPPGRKPRAADCPALPPSDAVAVAAMAGGMRCPAGQARGLTAFPSYVCCACSPRRALRMLWIGLTTAYITTAAREALIDDLFSCPYLGGNVVLGAERERHIAERHPDLRPEHRNRIAATLAAPDQVRRSRRFVGARLFSRWQSDLKDGKHVVVVIVGNAAVIGSSRRISRGPWLRERWNGREIDVQV